MSTKIPTRNRFQNQTSVMPRPDRKQKEWRYVDEGALTLARDEWDQAEAHRQFVESEVKRHDARIAANAEADAKATKAREDAVVNDEFRRRYLSAGGDPSAFERDLPELRREHAKRVALGIDQPINSLDVLKRELKALRGNVGHPPDAA